MGQPDGCLHQEQIRERTVHTLGHTALAQQCANHGQRIGLLAPRKDSKTWVGSLRIYSISQEEGAEGHRIRLDGLGSRDNNLIVELTHYLSTGVHGDQLSG